MLPQNVRNRNRSVVERIKPFSYCDTSPMIWVNYLTRRVVFSLSLFLTSLSCPKRQESVESCRAVHGEMESFQRCRQIFLQFYYPWNFCIYPFKTGVFKLCALRNTWGVCYNAGPQTLLSRGFCIKDHLGFVLESRTLGSHIYLSWVWSSAHISVLTILPQARPEP